MTSRDNIEVPPLPPPPKTDTQYNTQYSDFALREYGRKCYEAGLDAASRAEPVKPAKPEAHRAVVELSREGFAWTDAPPDAEWIVATATLCWTDDGRAWIESEDTQRHAANLRIMSANKEDYSEFAVCLAAADSLDGGVR